MQLVQQYDRGLSELPGIEPIARPGFGRHAHHLYVVRIEPTWPAATATATRPR